MTSLLPSQLTRAFGGATAAMGAVTIVAAPLLARRATAAGRPVPDPRIVRVLGARQLAQGALVTAAPDPAMASLGVVSDLAHATSMFLLAAASGRFRRPALLSGTLAVACGAAGAAVARQQRADPR